MARGFGPGRGRVVWTALFACVLVAGLAGAATAGAAKLKTRSNATIGSGNQTQVSASATCPKGTRAVGGGFSVSPRIADSPGLAAVVGESRKLGQRGWTASAFIADLAPPGGSVSLETRVYCREDAPKTKQVAVTQAFPQAAANGLAVTAPCPSGRKAMAGGFTLGNPIRADGLRGGFVTDSFRLGANAWTTAISATGVSALTGTSHAYCAKARAPKPVSAETAIPNAPGPPIPFSALSAPCPGKRTAGAGGFTQSATTLGTLTAIEESFRQGKAWGLAGTHIANSQTLTALAYCG